MKNNQLLVGGSVELLSQSEMLQTSGGGWFKDLVNGFKEGWNYVISLFEKKK
jgi:hypothetical protein